MARAEDNIRRYGISNQATLNTVYMDHLIDVSDISASNVLYDFSLPATGTQEDITPTLITLPTFKSPSKRIKNDKLPSLERLFFCNECGASFSNSSNLKSHLRIHTGEKPFSCDVCSMSFVQSSNLKAHKRTHTGERPFKCLECGKAFSRSSHLIGHKRIHTGEMPYSCGVCSRSFSSSTQLRKHTEKHTGSDSYVCSICEKSFSKSSALAIHLRIHSGDRPYLCVLCTAAFRSREDLNVHKKLHPGDEYPYSCKVCSKGFKIKLCCEKHAEKCARRNEPSSGNDFLLSFFGSNSFEEGSAEETEESYDYNQSQVFQFDDTNGVNGVCKMELLEDTIEDGIEYEVDEQMMVFTNEGGNSVLHVIPSDVSFPKTLG